MRTVSGYLLIHSEIYDVLQIVLNLYVPGRVSKQVTNGSKTAVMDVISFLYVSLGSSTVQLCDSLGSKRTCSCSEAGFGTQNGNRA
jgi:hypothetical protein